MNTPFTTIETRHTPVELISRIKEMTVPDFESVPGSPHAHYYGEVGSYSFDIKHVRYGPMSAVPSIVGDIREGVNGSVIKLEFDIEEHYTMTKRMYGATLIPLSLIFILLSVLMHWGTEYQWQSLTASGSFLAMSLLIIWFAKVSLKSIRKKELGEFIEAVDGHVMVNTSLGDHRHSLELSPA